jgi:hypothetical protein
MTNEHKIIATKLGALKLAERLGNVSDACKVMGYSRNSFYRFNRERTHTGKYCFGRTPLQTFRETKHLAQAKQLDTLFEQPDGELSNPDVSVEKVVG